jgi:hypothetical protein
MMITVLGHAEYYSSVLKRSLTQLGDFKLIYMSELVQEYSFILFQYVVCVPNSEEELVRSVGNNHS